MGDQTAVGVLCSSGSLTCAKLVTRLRTSTGQQLGSSSVQT